MAQCSLFVLKVPLNTNKPNGAIVCDADCVYITSGVTRPGCQPVQCSVWWPCWKQCTRQTLRLSSSAPPPTCCWRWRRAVPTTTERCLNSRCHSASFTCVS